MAAGSGFYSIGGAVTTSQPSTHAAVVVQPSSVTAGSTFTIEVDAEDANNDVDPTYNGQITVSLGNNPGGSTLSGTVTLAAVHGVATFSGLALHKVGTGYTLNVVAAGLTGTSVGAFNVTSGGTTATPQVMGVQVAGSSWSAAYLSALTTAGDGNGLGYAIPVGSAAQTAALPWSNLNQIQITFNEDVNVSQASLALTGVNVASYSITGFSYNSVTHTGTWTVAGSIGTDRLHVDLKSTGASAVTDAIGTGLDGEWTDGTSSYPSGNGTAGGDFNFHFNVLPGDVTQNGIVNGLDINLIATNWLHVGRVMGDSNGDDIINGLDINTIATHWLAKLPAGGGSGSGENGASLSALAAGVSPPALQAALATNSMPSVAALSSAALSSPAPVDHTASFLGQGTTLTGAAVDTVFATDTAAGIDASHRLRLLGVLANGVSSAYAQAPAKVQRAVAEHASALEEDLLDALAISRGGG
jgi:hypothetical protein